MGRTNKGIRFDDDALKLADALLPYLPQHTSQADLLHEAALIGLQVLATRAPSEAALPRFAGREMPQGLPGLLWQTLAYAIEYLAEHGVLPRRYLSLVVVSGVTPGGEPQATRHEEAEQQETDEDKPADMSQIVDQEAAEFLDDMGSNLL